MKDLCDRVYAKYHAEIYRNTKVMADWNISFSYFQLDSWTDQFAIRGAKSAIVVIILVAVGKVIMLEVAFKFKATAEQAPTAVTLVATHFEFCSYQRCNFEVDH